MFPEVILDQTLSLKLMFGRVLALIKIPPYLTLSRGEGYNQVFELAYSWMGIFLKNELAYSWMGSTLLKLARVMGRAQSYMHHK